MADTLDKVIDTAKKLRRLAKKTNDPDIQSLVVDLNLSLADLKLEMVERAQEERQSKQQPKAANKPQEREPVGSVGAPRTYTSSFNTPNRPQS